MGAACCTRYGCSTLPGSVAVSVEYVAELDVGCGVMLPWPERNSYLDNGTSSGRKLENSRLHTLQCLLPQNVCRGSTISCFPTPTYTCMAANFGSGREYGISHSQRYSALPDKKRTSAISKDGRYIKMSMHLLAYYKITRVISFSYAHLAL